MPIQLQSVHSQDDSSECPLCMEALEVDDINFFPCQCGYQICRFCWHRIRTDENGLCPACRKPYPENPAEFKPLSEQELQNIRQVKKQKAAERKQKISDNRRHLASVRVLQKNLVFVVGLSQRLADPEVLKKPGYFGKYGKILKVVINNNTSYAGSQSPSSTAYVTYSKVEDALRAIQSVNNVYIDGRTLKASLGTTKYCSNYLKNQQCTKTDCMYLHETGDQEASFTKDDMQASKHQEYEQKLIQDMLNREKEQSDTTRRNSVDKDSSPKLGEHMDTNGSRGPKERIRRHSGSIDKPSSPLPRHATMRSNSVKGTSKYSSSAGDTTSVKIESKRSGPRSKKSKHHRVDSIDKMNENSPSQNDNRGSPVNLESYDKDKPAELPDPQTNLNKDDATKKDTSSQGDGFEPQFPTLPIDIPHSPKDAQTSSTTSTGQYNSSCSDTSSSIGQGLSSVEGSYIQHSQTPPTHNTTSPVTHNATSPKPDQTNATAQSRLLSYTNTEFGSSLFSNTMHGGSENADHSRQHRDNDMNQIAINISSTLFPNSLPPGMTDLPSSHGKWGTSANNNKPPHTRNTESQPVPSKEWESLFGLSSSLSRRNENPPTEDDLGFDPFAECTKGLADLMEKELSFEPPSLYELTNPQSSSSFAPSSDYNNSLPPMQRPESLPGNYRSQPNPPPNLPPFGQFSMYDHRKEIQQPLGGDFPQQLPSWNTFLNNISPQKPPAGFPPQRNGIPTSSTNFPASSFMNRNPYSNPPTSQPSQEDWQNELRALLPTVNINFATNTAKTNNTGFNSDPFMLSKSKVPPPPGVGGFVNRTNPPPSQQQRYNTNIQNKHHWSSQNSPVTPNSPGFNRLMSPTRNTMFPNTSYETAMHTTNTNEQQNLFRDPAIITGANTEAYTNNLFGSKVATNFGNNNNQVEETPHWLNSLHNLTETDNSPISPAPPSFHGAPTSNNTTFGWPTSNNFGSSGLNTSHPPPGFHTRRNLDSHITY